MVRSTDIAMTALLPNSPQTAGRSAILLAICRRPAHIGADLADRHGAASSVLLLPCHLLFLLSLRVAVLDRIAPCSRALDGVLISAGLFRHPCARRCHRRAHFEHILGLPMAGFLSFSPSFLMSFLCDEGCGRGQGRGRLPGRAQQVHRAARVLQGSQRSTHHATSLMQHTTYPPLHLARHALLVQA